jgi:hypothetical protein
MVPCFKEMHLNFFDAQTENKKSVDFLIEYTSALAAPYTGLVIVVVPMFSDSSLESPREAWI